MGLVKQLKFQGYYHQYFQKIYNYIYFRTGGNRELAEDLTQEVFIKALEHFDDFDERAKFSTWIYTIAKNRIIDQYRKKNLAKVDLEDVENTTQASQGAEDDFLDDLNLEFDLDIVRHSLKALPDKYKEVITLKYINDLGTDEICQILNKDANYIRVTLHRGLKQLVSAVKNDKDNLLKHEIS